MGPPLATRRKVLAAFATFAAFAVACSPEPPRPVTPERLASDRAEVARALAIPDRSWGMLESRQHFVSVPLPDRSAWRVNESPLWLAAAHQESKSMLWVRAWRPGSVMSHALCEADARTQRPDLFGSDESALVDRRPRAAPAGFDSEVAFSVRKADTALGGIAVLVGARVRECLVIVYATKADGDSAPEAISHRLAFMAERVFPGVVFRKVEDRVVPSRAEPR
jgi:hypothetical protein